MIPELAGLAAAAIALPYLLSLRRASPPAAIAVWLAALVLRAVAGMMIALLIATYLPTSEAFGVLTHWCWHTVLPFVATHLGFSGHALGHAAAVFPELLVVSSVLSAFVAVLGAARAVRRALRARALGAGPMGSVIVGGPTVVVAAAGLARPKVIVSAGALTLLDDAELAASLEHERGHIARRHRFILLLGETCRALGLLVPGGRAAVAELAFHVERDADAYALHRAHDRLALASAICKAATTSASGAALTGLSHDGSITGRVRLLMDGGSSGRRGPERARTLAAAVVACLALAVAVALPPVAAASMTASARPATAQTCPA